MPETTVSNETTAAPDSRADSPALRIVSANTTPEEIAAIVAVLSAVGGAPAPARRPAPAWAAPHRAVRRPLPHGPGAWRASGLPR